MKSTSGEHFVGLDHVRALAAFLVVAWHFNHNAWGFPIPVGAAPAVFPLAIVDQGHTGVALFMCLSGYLFAKLLDGKQIHYPSFLWNRALRLLPLLVVAILLHALLAFFADDDMGDYWTRIVQGIVLPTLPAGGWSITTEFHFYLILPLLLWLSRRNAVLPLALVAIAFAVRALIYLDTGEVWSYAYWTIVGRIDQFTLGVVAFSFRDRMKGRHGLAIGLFLLISVVFYLVDSDVAATMVPTSPLWIWLATIEAFVYATLIAWYDASFRMRNVGLSRWVGLLGAYSYSIYLLHVFFVDRASWFIDHHVMKLSNFYVASAWAFLFTIGMMVVGHVSFRCIEAPFLRHRKRYTLAGRGGDVFAAAPESAAVGAK